MRSERLIHPLLLLLLFSCASAKGETSTARLEQSTHDYLVKQAALQPNLKGRLEIQVNPLDRRLKLASCNKPLQFDHKPLKAGRQSLRVQCRSPKPWSVFVTATIRQFQPVLVSSRALLRGERITPSNTHLEERDTSRLRQGFFTAESEAVGAELRRNLRANAPLTPNLLRPALLIHREDQITIEAGSGALSVRMEGTALEDGRKGQQIRVKNSRSGRVIKARVIAPGLVQAGP